MSSFSLPVRIEEPSSGILLGAYILTLKVWPVVDVNVGLQYSMLFLRLRHLTLNESGVRVAKTPQVSDVRRLTSGLACFLWAMSGTA